MGITTEQRLSICKFLAEKLGKPNVSISDGKVIYFSAFEGMGIYDLVAFDPFAYPAQRMEVIDAAWAAGYNPVMRDNRCVISGWLVDAIETHDSTPESRAEAVLAAIAKAWGWEE